MNTSATTYKRLPTSSRAGRDYGARVAALKRARGALAHGKVHVSRGLAKLRKERSRTLPARSR